MDGARGSQPGMRNSLEATWWRVSLQEPRGVWKEPLCPQRRPHQQADALSGQAAGGQLCSQISGRGPGGPSSGATIQDLLAPVSPKACPFRDTFLKEAINRKLACSS